MAQINITLSEEEVKQVITGDRNEALKFLLEKLLNEIMKAESDEQIGASKHERSENRSDYRNGTRERPLTTRIGTLILKVPRHRNEPFHTMVFENYKRSEASLIATMVQMVIAGVSTRKVGRVVEELCGKEFSKSAVSELCKRLDGDINNFLNQSLENYDAPFVMLDATYFKVRENHRIVSKAFMIAKAFKSDGTREVIGFNVYDTEDNYSWNNFLDSLKNRGLNSVQMFTSDSHKSIRYAIAKVYPDAAWQRCQVHFLRNILDEMPPKYRDGIRTELHQMFNAKTIEAARKIKDEIVAEYEPVAEKAMTILENGFEDSMTVMCIPACMRTVLRSTNVLERLNRELKRRSGVIMVFPDTASIMRLMGAVTMEYSDTLSSKRCLFTESKFKELRPAISKQLIQTARHQVGLLAA